MMASVQACAAWPGANTGTPAGRHTFVAVVKQVEQRQHHADLRAVGGLVRESEGVRRHLRMRGKASTLRQAPVGATADLLLE